MQYVLTDDEKAGLILAATRTSYGQSKFIDSLFPFYSGRFMNGETCFGIVTSNASHVYFLLGTLGGTHLDLSIQLMNSHRCDNLGKDYIVYFPGYLWTEEVTLGAVDT